MYKAIMTTSNGSGDGPDMINPQVFQELNTKSNGIAALNFRKSLNKLLNPIDEDKLHKQLIRSFLEQKFLPS